jgi:hypothetical protein
MLRIIVRLYRAFRFEEPADVDETKRTMSRQRTGAKATAFPLILIRTKW